MAFGFNNPLVFADPTGLAPDCEGCPEFQLPLVTVSSKPDQSNRMMLESQLQLMRQSRNPVYRNLGQTAYREGLKAARDLYQRGRKLHFSETQAQASRHSPYLEGIGKMVSYGISGSMVAAAASPSLVRGMVEGLGGRVVQRMGIEAALQTGMSFTFNGRLGESDVADIGMTGLFGKWAFISNALIDIKPDQGFATTFGVGKRKSIYETSIDMGIGAYNRSFNLLLNTSEINKSVVKVISSINGSSRIIVGETIKKSQKMYNRELIKTTIKILLVLVFVYFGNQWYENRYDAFEKNYVVGELEKTYRIYGQGTSIDFSFTYYGKKYDASNYLGTNKLASKKYLIEVPTTNLKKSRILWDYPVPETLKAPYEGWEEIPAFVKKKEGD
ncbi:hypothetical protein [Cyclobacterium xiamenense]|uniref:hypothetical protein n=1 Tax=Cyclobacterium xiamenense TaxID=1297121 RepID=UPI0035D05832